ncbi:pilus assembly protein [Sphingomonas sp. MA1305]|nr:pilus assembly protein [Sphingomonas sp. MA1305]
MILGSRWTYMAQSLARHGTARRGLARIREDRRGVSLLEFALVAAPFIALMLAALQTSLLYFAQEGLETAVEATARSVTTGQAQAADATATSMTSAQLASRFRTQACARLPAYLSCSRLFVEVKSATNWSAMTTDLPDLTKDSSGNLKTPMSYSLGSQGSVVMVRLLYMWPLQTGPLGLDFSDQGRNTRLIMATSVAKTENY